MSLTDAEKQIFAEAKKVRAAALEEAIKLRRSKFAAEMAKIEVELEQLIQEDPLAPVESPPEAKPAPETPKAPSTRSGPGKKAENAPKS